MFLLTVLSNLLLASTVLAAPTKSIKNVATNESPIGAICHPPQTYPCGLFACCSKDMSKSPESAESVTESPTGVNCNPPQTYPCGNSGRCCSHLMLKSITSAEARCPYGTCGALGNICCGDPRKTEPTETQRAHDNGICGENCCGDKAE